MLTGWMLAFVLSATLTLGTALPVALIEDDAVAVVVMGAAIVLSGMLYGAAVYFVMWRPLVELASEARAGHAVPPRWGVKEVMRLRAVFGVIVPRTDALRLHLFVTGSAVTGPAKAAADALLGRGTGLTGPAAVAKDNSNGNGVDHGALDADNGDYGDTLDANYQQQQQATSGNPLPPTAPAAVSPGARRPPRPSSSGDGAAPAAGRPQQQSPLLPTSQSGTQAPAAALSNTGASGTHNGTNSQRSPYRVPDLPPPGMDAAVDGHTSDAFSDERQTDDDSDHHRNSAHEVDGYYRQEAPFGGTPQVTSVGGSAGDNAQGIGQQGSLGSRRYSHASEDISN